MCVCAAGPGGIETHAWSLMSTVMTEVLSKTDWLKLWDHVLSNSPPFLLFLLLSYLLYFKAQILSAESMEQMEGITRRCNPLDLNKVGPHACVVVSSSLPLSLLLLLLLLPFSLGCLHFHSNKSLQLPNLMTVIVNITTVTYISFLPLLLLLRLLLVHLNNMGTLQTIA